MQEHRVPGIHNETMYCGSASNHSRKEVNDGSVTAAAFREIRQEEIMCPILESSDHNHPLHDDSDDSVYNNIQSQQDEQLRLKTLQGLNSETMQYSDFQDRTGFLPENAMEMPLPPQFQLPSKHSLNMHPIELELMLFLNENYLPPVYFDHLMKWLFKAKAMKYFDGRYQAPSYQTLKKRMDISFPPTLAGGQLLTKQIKIDNNSNMIIPRTLHYFEPVQLMAGLLRDSDIMQHFVCHPQVKLTTCGERIYDEVTSATWFENAFNNSPASENGVLKSRQGVYLLP